MTAEHSDPTGAGHKTGETPKVRLQKLLAEAGLGSRRALEKRIAAGEVLINGQQASLGATAMEGDTLAVDQRKWIVEQRRVRHRCLVYNKPLGEVTSRSDPSGRPTVFDALPRVREGRWVAVGRLDLNTTGLLLLTTDGELAHAMMHPSNQVDREYACRILGDVTPDMISALRSGVELDDGPAHFSDIVASGGTGANSWFHVTLLEGRNREVRRLWASQGVTVSRLKRVRYGAVFLPKRLMMGKYSELTPEDHQVLREDVGLATASSVPVLKEIGKKAGRARTVRKGRGQRGAQKAPGMIRKSRRKGKVQSSQAGKSGENPAGSERSKGVSKPDNRKRGQNARVWESDSHSKGKRRSGTDSGSASRKKARQTARRPSDES